MKVRFNGEKRKGKRNTVYNSYEEINSVFLNKSIELR